jgi:SulP family sulfate permease
VAILVTTAAVHLFDLPVETIGSRFGAVPNTFPTPRLPSVSWETFTQMFSPALTVALLGAIESLLSAVVADGMTGTRHRSNMELIGQGIANLAAPIFGGIPATGAIARTATNIKNGGRTPVAGIIHAVTLLLIMLFFGQWAALIPMATLAAILIKLLRSPKSDIAVLLTTFFLTVLIDLTVAIQIGMVMAAFLFMNRMANVTQAGFLKKTMQDDEENPDDPLATSKRTIPEGVEVFEIDGPFFFGAADKFKDALRQVETTPKVLILRMRNVPAMDATGLRALEDVYEKTRREGTQLVLSGVHAQPLVAMQRSGFLDRIGEENTFDHIDLALERAQALVQATRPPNHARKS